MVCGQECGAYDDILFRHSEAVVAYGYEGGGVDAGAHDPFAEGVPVVSDGREVDGSTGLGRQRGGINGAVDDRSQNDGAVDCERGAMIVFIVL